MITNILSEELKQSLFGIERLRCSVLKRSKTDLENKEIYSVVTKSLNGVLSDLIVLDDYSVGGGNKKSEKKIANRETIRKVPFFSNKNETTFKYEKRTKHNF